MKNVRYPSYYKDFSCIASACTDSCCEGWGIDIDSDTLAYYRSIEGSFGERLKENICWEEIEDTPHFLTNEKNRCPFLNDHNLCDIFIHLGEEHLCQICTDHPRFYEWMTNITEAGLGLCCEEAVRLIISQKGLPTFYEVEEEDFDDSHDVQELDAMTDLFIHASTDGSIRKDQDAKVEDFLFDLRRQAFLAIDQEQTLEDRLEQLLSLSSPFQEALDDLLYPFIEEEDCFLDGDEANNEANFQDEEDFQDEAGLSKTSWEQTFWSVDNLSDLIDIYLGLEINESAWEDRLLALKDDLSQLCDTKSSYMLELAQEEDSILTQLLYYYLYRYLLKARYDESIREKIFFTLGCVSMIRLLFLDEWRKTGSLTSWQQILQIKQYSKEIEYNEANMEELSYALTEWFEEHSIQ